MRTSYFLVALLAFSAVAFVGCDSNDDNDGDVLGLWFADEIDGDEESIYLDIAADEVVQYVFLDADIPDFEPCYLIARVEVVSRDDDEWVLEDEEGERFDATIRRDGDELVITSEGSTVRLVRSSEDPSTFTPECEDGGRSGR